MDGTATINAKVDTLATVRIVQNLACAKPRLLKYEVDYSSTADGRRALRRMRVRRQEA